VNHPAANDDELYSLLGDWCNGTLSPQRRASLEDLLRSDPDVRQFYWDYMSLHSELSWRESASAQLSQRASELGRAAGPEAELPPARSPVLGFLGGLWSGSGETPGVTAFTWLLMGLICSGIVLTVFFCIVLVFRGGRSVPAIAPQMADRGGSEQGARSTERMGGGEMGRDRSSPHLPISLSPHPSEAAVARLINAYECRWAVGSHSPHPGDDLEPGRKLELLSGLAEIMFQSGARALLQGPGTMEISSRSVAVLRRGKLTIRVEDPDAVGFEVHAPGMKYTDLGTEFGVWVAKDGSQEMVVFRGAVQAEAVRLAEWEMGRSGNGEIGKSDTRAISPSPHPPLSPSSVVLTAHQAVRIEGSGAKIERIEGHEKRFARVSPVAPFAVSSTGAGLVRGAADPHWEITAISTEPDFQPRPAVVADPLSCYVRCDPAGGQWLSTSKNLGTLPDGCRMTFRTRFNLAGFVASTARIDGKISVDDFVAEVRLNGKNVPVPAGSRDKDVYKRWLKLAIESGFVEGDNTLDFVVENAFFGTQTNYVAFCADFTGTARPRPTTGAEE
jgi:hypothetical protein